MTDEQARAIRAACRDAGVAMLRAVADHIALERVGTCGRCGGDVGKDRLNPIARCFACGEAPR